MSCALRAEKVGINATSESECMKQRTTARVTVVIRKSSWPPSRDKSIQAETSRE